MEKTQTSTPILSLIIRNRSPLNTGDIGALLSALSSDYEKTTKGRNLSIVSLKNGSLWIVLTDAALIAAPYVAGTIAVATGANTLLDFFKKLENLLSKAKSDPSDSGIFQKKRKPAMKSIERIVETAVNSSAQIEVTYRNQDGEELTVSVSPDEAKLICKTVDLGAPYRVARTDVAPAKTPQISIADRIDQTIERVSRDGVTDDTVAIVEMLADVLKENSSYHVIHTLAARLDQAGQFHLARVVRNRGAGGSDREIQPVRS